MRVALYSRVSTSDQARFGISIEAQMDALRKWAKENKHTIVGEYVDAGISGKKPYRKRPELSRFMDDLEAGLKVDALVFCKLDRFYRSVKLYYQAVDILDRHKVAWIAIQEDYETATASGRMKVNIMLSVAENEADRTSERIKTVFEHKIEKGEAITRCQPFGYELQDGKVVPNEYAPAAREMFETFAATGNTWRVREMIQEKYGVRLNYESVYRFLQNPIYIGQYRENANYCAPIVSRETFEQVQKDFAERRKARRAPTGRIYLFSGLLVCRECGRKLIAAYRNGLTYYRCTGYYYKHLCAHKKILSEKKTEEALLLAIGTKLDEPHQFRPAKKEKPVDRAAIQRKLDRLTELYIEGDISKDKYTTQKEALSALLLQPKRPKDINTIITKDFKTEYEAMTREERQSIWRSIIDRIEVDEENNIEVYFLQ